MLTNFIQTIKINTKIRVVFLALFCAFLYVNSLSAQKKFTVVLDAGHGGREPGKVGIRGYKEKNIALKIVLKVGKLLNKEKNIKVVYTRKKDVFVGLWERGNIANKANADLFVSVHCNAHHTQAFGSETWVLGLHANKKNFEVAKSENAVIKYEKDYKKKYKGFNPDSPESIASLSLLQEENLDKSLLLASIIQQNFKIKIKRVDRGVKQAGFVVLYQTTMPSVLVEAGFLTHKKEGKYLFSSKGQTKIASSIATAVKKYLTVLQANTVKEETKSPKKELAKAEVVFKVQIASGKNKLATKSYNFKGLKDIERKKVGAYYKYYYGASNSYKHTQKALKFAKEKGYKSAFIVAFKGTERVPLSKVLK